MQVKNTEILLSCGHGSIYELSVCKSCRVAKIHSSRPSRERQNFDVWYIEHYHGISKEQVYQELKEHKEQCDV